ncbi:hypothetical protein BC829DRAFT_365459 [Chytridium lagenaria]|nr:hypothetical protein BC829DRAFT_365459 [Chytridium lagenaria]
MLWPTIHVLISFSFYSLLVCSTSLIPICGHVFLHTSLRSSLRTTYNIRGSSIDDTAVSCFCLPCALTQEQREIEAWDSAVADHRRSRQSILVLSGELNDLKERGLLRLISVREK